MIQIKTKLKAIKPQETTTLAEYHNKILTAVSDYFAKSVNQNRY